jgi:hypothetical protein
MICNPLGPPWRVSCARAAKDVTMRTRTTALALASTLLAAPAAAAAESDDPPSPTRAALSASIAGHLTVRAQMRAAHRSGVQAELTDRALRLAREVGGISARAELRRLRGQAPDEIRARIRVLRRELNAPAASPALQAIAECESGGNPATDTGNGFYGKYQFTIETWNAVGGSGNPANASEAEQDRRAAMLYARAGAAPWPVCGR